VANREHSTQFNRHFPDGHDRDDEPDCSASVVGRKISRTQVSCEYTLFLQLDWLWRRNQPQSALALWFKERVNRNGGRLKMTTIVALARKLLVALWKYVTPGVVNGDMVIVLFDATATARDGVPYNYTYTWYFQMKDAMS
jgi:hypothetical protein